MYVKKEDYLHETSIDLNVEFRGSNYDSANAIDEFIDRAEEATIDYLKYNYDNEDDFIEKMSESTLAKFKKGLIYQIQYFVQVGEIYNDATTDKPILCNRAKSIFRTIGLCNYRGY
jgi:hypothetical protein